MSKKTFLERIGVKSVFDVDKAEEIHAEIIAAKSNGQDTEGLVPLAIKLTVKAMGIRNTVGEGIEQRNSQSAEETTELNAANTETTVAEEIAQANLLKQIEMLKKARDLAAAKAKEEIEENTRRIGELEQETARTKELSIYA